MIREHELNIIVRAFEKLIVPISIMKGNDRFVVLACVEVVIWVLLFPYEFLLFTLALFF